MVEYDAIPEPTEVFLVLGQEQDSFGGGTETHQSYSGFISLFDIWSYVLKMATLNKIDSCKSVPHGDIINWESESWTEGVINKTQVDLTNLCGSDPLFGLFVQKEVDFHQGRQNCKRQKGTINPTTDLASIHHDDNQYSKLVDVLDLDAYPSCTVNGGIHRWLGFYASDSGSNWIDSDTSITVGGTVFGKKAEPGNCLYAWYDRIRNTSCVDGRSCIFCSLSPLSWVIVKGLSNEKVFKNNIYDRVMYSYGRVNNQPRWRYTYFCNHLKKF